MGVRIDLQAQRIEPVVVVLQQENAGGGREAGSLPRIVAGQCEGRNLLQARHQPGGQRGVFQLQRIREMPVGRAGHVAHARQVEVAVEVLFNLRRQVPQMHVAIQVGRHHIRREIDRRAVGRLGNFPI